MDVSELLNFFRSEYRPAPGEFLPIDMPSLVEKMHLRERGAERGKQGIPAAESSSFDEIEYGITEAIRTLALSEEKRTYDQVSYYDQQLRSADPSGAAADMRATATQAVTQFSAEALAARSELEVAKRDVIGRAEELNAFRQKNQLKRLAAPTKNHVWNAGVLAILFLIETGPNAFLLGAGDEQGVLGGYAISIVFSALNLLAGFVAGMFAWTNATHKAPGRKLTGLFIALLLFVFSVALNLVVVHIRESVSTGTDTAAALRDAWRILFSPEAFKFHDPLSVGLGLLGASFSLWAAYEGLNWRDSYPRYSKVSNNLRMAELKWALVVEQRLTFLNNVQEAHSNQLRAARAQLRDRRAAVPEIISARARLLRNFDLHIRHLEGVGRYALAAYRDANRAARSANSPSPARFDAAWVLQGISIPSPIAIDPTSAEEWKAANDALETSMDKLQGAFQDALTWIQDLNAEVSGAAGWPLQPEQA